MRAGRSNNGVTVRGTAGRSPPSNSTVEPNLAEPASPWASIGSGWRGPSRAASHIIGSTTSATGNAHHIGPARLASKLPTMAPSANAAEPAACTRVSTGRASSRSTALASVFIAMSSSPTVPPTSVNAAVSAYGVPAPNRQANAVACNGSVTRINRRGAMKRTSQPPVVIAPT